jgi:hypothetical protein
MSSQKSGLYWTHTPAIDEIPPVQGFTDQHNSPQLPGTMSIGMVWCLMMMEEGRWDHSLCLSRIANWLRARGCVRNGAIDMRTMRRLASDFAFADWLRNLRIRRRLKRSRDAHDALMNEDSDAGQGYTSALECSCCGDSDCLSNCDSDSE